MSLTKIESKEVLGKEKLTVTKYYILKENCVKKNFVSIKWCAPKNLAWYRNFNSKEILSKKNAVLPKDLGKKFKIITYPGLLLCLQKG